MARRIVVDSKKLLQKIQDGTMQKEVLEKFGLSSEGQLQAACKRRLKKGGQGVGGRKGTAVAGRRIAVGKRGSIAIPKELVQTFGFCIGDAFQVSPSKTGLSLKKLKDK
jgi:hypothetical protein